MTLFPLTLCKQRPNSTAPSVVIPLLIIHDTPILPCPPTKPILLTIPRLIWPLIVPPPISQHVQPVVVLLEIVLLVAIGIEDRSCRGAVQRAETSETAGGGCGVGGGGVGVVGIGVVGVEVRGGLREGGGVGRGGRDETRDPLRRGEKEEKT